MSKEEMIASIATAGVSKTYLESLKEMTEEQVGKEFAELGQSMKD